MNRRKFLRIMGAVPAVALVPTLVRDFGIPAGDGVFTQVEMPISIYGRVELYHTDFGTMKVMAKDMMRKTEALLTDMVHVSDPMTAAKLQGHLDKLLALPAPDRSATKGWDTSVEDDWTQDELRG